MSGRGATGKKPKVTGKSFACLVEGCGVVRRCRPEMFGHMVLVHHRAVDKVIDPSDGSMDYVVRDAVAGDYRKAWADFYCENPTTFDDRLARGLIDEQGQTKGKRGPKKGSGRPKKASKGTGKKLTGVPGKLVPVVVLDRLEGTEVAGGVRQDPGLNLVVAPAATAVVSSSAVCIAVVSSVVSRPLVSEVVETPRVCVDVDVDVDVSDSDTIVQDEGDSVDQSGKVVLERIESIDFSRDSRWVEVRTSSREALDRQRVARLEIKQEIAGLVAKPSVDSSLDRGQVASCSRIELGTRVVPLVGFGGQVVLGLGSSSEDERVVEKSSRFMEFRR